MLVPDPRMSPKNIFIAPVLSFLPVLTGACATGSAQEPVQKAAEPPAVATPQAEAPQLVEAAPAAPVEQPPEPPATSTSAAPEEPQEVAPSFVPKLHDEGGASLPQTEDRPSLESPWFQHGIRLLFSAIVKDDANIALPFFFPQVAYKQVKDIQDPDTDYERRLIAAFRRDIHTHHQAMGKFRDEAEFVGVRVAEHLAKWVPPGKEANKVGYFRVLRSVLLYRDQLGRNRELNLLSMISWRGEWYVVHLDKI